MPVDKVLHLAGLMAGGVAFGVAFGGLAAGLALGVVPGVLTATTFGVAGAIAGAGAVRVAEGSPFLVAFGLVFGVTFSAAVGALVAGAMLVFIGPPKKAPMMAFEAQGVVLAGVLIGVAFGVAFGVDGGMAVGVAGGVVVGVAFSALFLRLALWPIEAALQIHLYRTQTATGRVTLGRSPLLWHDLSYLPLPFLRKHIVETAKHNPDLARLAIDRCRDVPGQRRIGRSALRELQARELVTLARQRDFAALTDLEGAWLPGKVDAPPTLLALSDVAAYLRAAQTALVPYHRLGHIANAERDLGSLQNRLRGEASEDATAYLDVATSWSAVIAECRAEAEAAAAHVLPNPFRAGPPLTPEQGMELFRGREQIIRRIETVLGDAATSASLVLLAPRRCGKTTLLNMLPAKLPGTLCVFFDIQDNPTDSVGRLANALVDRAKQQASKAGKPTIPDLPDGSPMEALSRWIDALNGHYPSGVLIALDEFERLAVGNLWPGTDLEFRQFMGLLRATIQHRRRVRLLVAGATPFDELGAVWNDHFINVREIRFGHFDPAVARDLLCRPIPDFPADAIPPRVAEQVVERTGAQPFLVQLYGQVLVTRLNDQQRREATLEDVEDVETAILMNADAQYYFRNTVIDAPPEACAAMIAAAHGTPASVAPAVRRWLTARCLIHEGGQLTIPVLGRYIREEQLTA